MSHERHPWVLEALVNRMRAGFRVPLGVLIWQQLLTWDRVGRCWLDSHTAAGEAVERLCIWSKKAQKGTRFLS